MFATPATVAVALATALGAASREEYGGDHVAWWDQDDVVVEVSGAEVFVAGKSWRRDAVTEEWRSEAWSVRLRWAAGAALPTCTRAGRPTQHVADCALIVQSVTGLPAELFTGNAQDV